MHAKSLVAASQRQTAAAAQSEVKVAQVVTSVEQLVPEDAKEPPESEPRGHVREASELALRLLEGETSRRLVATLVTALHVVSHTLRQEQVTGATSDALRLAAQAVESQVLQQTTANALRLAAQAMENENVTSSLAASMDLTARTLENETVGAGVNQALVATDRALSRCLALVAAALQNERVIAGAQGGADLISRAAESRTVKAIGERASKALEHPVVSNAATMASDLAHRTLQNETVQRIGMASLDVATRVAGNEKVQALGAKTAEYAAGVVNAAATSEALGAAVHGAVRVSSAVGTRLQSLRPVETTPESILAETIRNRLIPPPTDAPTNVHELLDTNPSARRALVQLYLEQQERLALVEEALETSEKHAVEMAEALARGPVRTA